MDNPINLGNTLQHMLTALGALPVLMCAVVWILHRWAR